MRTGRLQRAGALIRMDGGRLPNRVMFGEMEAGRKGKQWTDCVAVDIRAFGIGGDRKSSALKRGALDDTVVEGGRRFMAE